MDFITEKEIPNCVDCYTAEDKGGMSYRKVT